MTSPAAACKCALTWNATPRTSRRNAINGLPVVRFNGIGTNMYDPITTYPTGNFTCYVVTQATAKQVDGDSYNRLLSCPATNDSDYNYGFNLEYGNWNVYSPCITQMNATVISGQTINTFGLGAQFNSQGNVHGGAFFTGDIGEVLIYNQHAQFERQHSGSSTT